MSHPIEGLVIPFQTLSGVWLDILNPDPSKVNLEDIAYGQAGIMRFNGQTRYPLAAHSVWVSRYVPRDYAVPALLHDAHEYITGDITTPMKRAIERIAAHAGCTLDPVAELQRLWDKAIATRFGFEPELMYAQPVKDADRAACQAEANAFLPDATRGYGGFPPGWTGSHTPSWSVPDYTVLFMARARELGVK